MSSQSIKVKTKLYPKLLHTDVATNIYNHLVENVEWSDGIYSRRYRGSTRKAYQEGNDEDIDLYLQVIVSDVLQQINKDTGKKYLSHGIYVNYYRDGNDFLPQHSHQGTIQLVISLGATRSLKVSSKTYEMSNGDCVMFGSAPHGIVKQTSITTGRISIATFLREI